MDWFVWRIVAHERRLATLEQIEQYFSVEDLVDAHLVLDMYDRLDRLAALKARNP